MDLTQEKEKVDNSLCEMINKTMENIQHGYKDNVIRKGEIGSGKKEMLRILAKW